MDKKVNFAPIRLSLRRWFSCKSNSCRQIGFSSIMTGDLSFPSFCHISFFNIDYFMLPSPFYTACYPVRDFNLPLTLDTVFQPVTKSSLHIIHSLPLVSSECCFTPPCPPAFYKSTVRNKPTCPESIHNIPFVLVGHCSSTSYFRWLPHVASVAI